MDPVHLQTVLVTGASGFLATHIVHGLLAKNNATKIIKASRNVTAEPQPTDPRIVHHMLDVTSSDSVGILFNVFKPTVVIHTVSAPSDSHASLHEATNVRGTNNLLKAARECPETKAFVYTSSDSACHSSPFTQITEDQCILYSPSDAPNPYARTKAIADAAVLAANSPELRTATMRLPAIYGEGDTRFIPLVIESIQKGQWKNQLGPNTKFFEFVLVDAAAQAHILAAEALVSGKKGADGQGYFVSDGKAMPFFDFMRKCYAVAGCRVAKEDVKVIPFWVARAMASIGEWFYWIFTLGMLTPKMRRVNLDHLDTGCHWSIEKAQHVLGYLPVSDQDDAIKRAMEWGLKTYS